MKKLLLIGACKDSVHVQNYHNLIKSYFDQILIVTNTPIDFCEYKELDFSLKNPLKFYQNIKLMRKIMEDFQPSIVHVHQANTYAYLAVLANQSKFPTVLTVWGSDVLILPSQGVLYRHIVQYSLKKADFVTADASFMKDAINKLAEKEVTIANFGIDFESKEIPEKKNHIYSNRLHKPLYRIEEIIEGFAEFHKSNLDWKLIIGANGILTEKLKNLAAELLPQNSYEFIGFVDKAENQKRFLESKIWISNPKSDGTAISLLEAMGFGCIPVVSCLPANKEWIINNENGLIIDNSISDSLSKAKDLSLEKVQQINRTIIETRATKAVNKEKFISLYKKILNLND